MARKRLKDLRRRVYQVLEQGPVGAVLDARGRLIGVLLAPADPHPKTCRTTASPTLLALFPVLARPAAPRKAGLRR